MHRTGDGERIVVSLIVVGLLLFLMFGLLAFKKNNCAAICKQYGFSDCDLVGRDAVPFCVAADGGMHRVPGGGCNSW